MNETDVTVLGFVGTDPELRRVGDVPVAGFRVGSTPRTFSARDNTWSDRGTNWFTVNAWRALGEHCAASLHVGEPVIVRGRLRTQSWTDDAGITRTTFAIDAVSVGHDLTKGTSAFLRAQPAAQLTGQQSPEEQELAQQNSTWSVPLPQVSSHGRFEEPAAGTDARAQAPEEALDEVAEEVGEAERAEQAEMAPF